LNPKKPKNILKDLHEDLELNQTLVNDVIDFYWNNVRKSISSVVYPRINIENFGVFEVKLKNITGTIIKYEHTLNSFKGDTFTKYQRYQAIKSRLDILLNTKETLLEERKRKETIKTNRYGRTNPNMEEEGKDS
jgi:nucleoid DNA-binding protein